MIKYSAVPTHRSFLSAFYFIFWGSAEVVIFPFKLL
jgi:hypothetical protein